ncbi:cryptochrome/photolyase family protein [Thiomicrospira sp. R3]|uniref:cryptochrome/photolyase family protein n=1 Tax=Thiomicrospira sp. R3 TaxID=3035472 RepID=UPI00259B5BEA|nr:cryptochrome/photolyase family protein [Thiomicrospira sp. R3]WFE69169.1 cryptochrome/photolyase family protein [Thiomicrospira sp. R3]
MIRKLVVVLGDQLNQDSGIWQDFDPQQDAVWMAEVMAESTHVKSHPQRITLFLSAMRHFAQTLRHQAWSLHYFQLGSHDFASFEQALGDFLSRHPVGSVELVVPGDYRVLQQIKTACHQAAIALSIQPDNHFIAEPGEFKAWLTGRKKPTMEYWYRTLRQRTGILMDGKKPLGGKWNYDADNRQSFGKAGPQAVPLPLRFAPDAITESVRLQVKTLFAAHPGQLDNFAWPVTRVQALQALDDFITYRLAKFGDYQDAMWPNQAWLYHSLLAVALNLKLLNPREVIAAAEQAYQQGRAPLNAVEGFVRQILGWREYVRGLYWSYMPDWLTMNALDAQQDLPAFYWTGQTEMACLKDSIGQVLEHGYGHHIQRLMVTGLFALLWQAKPEQVHEWYLAMYVDAVEWVELPNVLGMSQFADGGLMASKPYIASGQYIDKMSGYCQTCRYKPKEATGQQACPFTTLYWGFIEQHQERFRGHPRLGMQVRHLDAMSDEKRQQIEQQIVQLRLSLA